MILPANLFQKLWVDWTVRLQRVLVAYVMAREVCELFVVCCHFEEETVLGPRSARPIEAPIRSAQCEDYRVIQFLVVLDVRELVQHDHVQSLPANGVGIVWQSLYHGPVPKREPPLPRRTLEHLPSQPRQESRDLVYHLQALPLAWSNNRSSEPFPGESVEEDRYCHGEAFAALPRPAGENKLALVSEEFLLIDCGFEA